MIFLVSLLLSFSWSFTLTSSPNNKGYANSSITIYTNSASCPAGVNIRGLVADAVKVWNDVPYSNLKLKVGGETTATSATFPPTAYCDATMTGSTLGEGGSSYNPATRRLVGGFLRLNTNGGQPGYILDQTYNRQVITTAHELGHLIGLGHTDKAYSLMYYDIGSKSDLSLSQDDMDGLMYLYPADELSGDDLLGGCAMVDDTNHTGYPLGLVLLLPFLLFALRYSYQLKFFRWANRL